MEIIHTSYIKRMADQTGKTYRDLEHIWKKSQREVEHERMFDPNKFSHMRSGDGTISQEIAKRFEELALNPVGAENEVEPEIVDDAQFEPVDSEIGLDEVSEIEDPNLDQEVIEDEMIPDESIEADEADEADEFDGFDEPDTTLGDDEMSDEASDEPDINMDDFEDIKEL